MSSKKLSEYFQVSNSYFPVMKKLSPEKYDYIMSFDLNPIVSCKKFADFTNSLISDMEKVLFYFEESYYGLFLWRSNLLNYKNFKQIYNHDCKMIFCIREDDKDFFGITMQQINRWMNIVELFKKKLFFIFLVLFTYRDILNESLILSYFLFFI